MHYEDHSVMSSHRGRKPRDWVKVKIVLAFACMVVAVVTVLMRRQGSMDHDAERWLIAHLEGKCGPILGMITEQERRGIGLNDAGLCKVLKERVFPYTTGAKLVRIVQRASSETGGSCQAEVVLSNGERLSVTGFALRSDSGSVTRFSMSLRLTWSIRSHLDGTYTKDRMYRLPYLDEEAQALGALGVRELLPDSSYVSSMPLKQFFLEYRRSILMTKKYEEYLKLGVSSVDALEMVGKEFAGS